MEEARRSRNSHRHRTRNAAGWRMKEMEEVGNYGAEAGVGTIAEKVSVGRWVYCLPLS